MRHTPRALITGIAGQDGSYLSEWLLAKGYEVHGLLRPSDLQNETSLWRLTPFRDQLHLHALSQGDACAVKDLLKTLRPQECYHLSGTRKPQDGPREEEAYVGEAQGMTAALLEGLREAHPQGAFFFASSSEIYGSHPGPHQDENTAFQPRGAYGRAKVAGMEMVRHFRETKGLRACSGILFNHESPRRGAEFVTRKITHSAARIQVGLEQTCTLGDLDARRDWGYAPNFVQAMWLMLQQQEPMDLVLATGTSHSVRDFAEVAFGCLGLHYQDHVIEDPALVRPSEGVILGNPKLARERLGWWDSMAFRDLVREMVQADVERARLSLSRG